MKTKRFNREKMIRRAGYALFWSWHLIFILLTVTVLVPYITIPIFQDAFKGLVPWHYTLYSTGLVLLPLISALLGATRFRGQPVTLLRYFYGFEMTLWFFMLVRIITFRDFNPGVAWLIANIVLSQGAFFMLVWFQHKQVKEDSDSSGILYKDSATALLLSTITAMVGLYFGILFLIIMIPAGGAMIKYFFTLLISLFTDGFDSEMFFLFLHPLFYLWVVFLLFTSTLLIALPMIMVRLYLNQFMLRVRYLFNQGKIIGPVLVILLVIACNITGFIYCTRQPQQAIYTLLEKEMGEPERESVLLARSVEIRKGLLNGYLAPYRYVSTTGTSRSIAKHYQKIFNLPEPVAKLPQALFNGLAKPILYKGDNWEDRERAKKLYEQFFDVPIQKAERATIVKSIKRNWEFDGNEAGLLNAASHHVHLEKQVIKVKEQQGVGTVTIKQTLRNLTYEQQEAVIHFSLDEESVVTGLWLSDDANDPHKYAYTVAPRGAAQSVYKAEVQRRIDPALLEKTGPFQYRMRIYPVPAKPYRSKKGDPLFMELEYQTLAGNDGLWPVPQVLEQRNIFWDATTRRKVNGVEVTGDDAGEWIPALAIDTVHDSSQDSLTSVVNNWHIRAVPRVHKKEIIDINRPVVLLIDGSYSMTNNTSDLSRMVDALHRDGTEFDLFFCKNSCTAMNSIDEIKQQIFFGSSQVEEQVAAFLKSQGEKGYEAIIAVTDEGSYELSTEESVKGLDSTIPIWLVHAREQVPYAYSDQLLDLLQRSKGGVSTSIREALLRLAPQSILRAAGIHERRIHEHREIIDISNRYIWLREKSANSVPSSNPQLSKIVASHSINHRARTMDMQQLDNMDSIHALAKEEGIVSTYSSMLVLVNQRQKEALKKAEQEENRFAREIETGEQDTTLPADLLSVPSVPEPEEWALMIIAGLLLLMSFRKSFDRMYINS